MNRIFISHSSKQESFVKRMVEDIGQDRCIVDCYDFRAGEKLEEEIKRKINSSGVFCLLISETSLLSDWVTMETQYVREKVEANKIVFRAFIVDPSIIPTDSRISPWINKYLLHTIPSPKIIGRVLADNLRELDYNNYPVLKIRDSLFIGRGQALSELEIEQVLKSSVKAIVISGIPHVGRKRFALQYLRKVTGDERLNFCTISMEMGKSMEDLALYINDFVELFSRDKLLEILVCEKITKKQEAIVQLINKLYDYNQAILIYDEFGLIQRDGHIVDWFQDILKSPDLKKHAGLYIISKVGVSFKDVEFLPIVQKPLLPLDNRDIQAIVKAYSEPQQLRIPDNDIKTITTSVKGFPGYVFPIVDSWVKYNRFVAMEKLRELEKGVSDLLEYIVDILNENGNESRIQLLLLLAHFEMISIKQLKELYREPELEELLDGFQDLSVLEYFGYSREYIRIHPVVADFLKRSKRISLSKEFIEKVSKRASEIVKDVEMSEYDEDIATYMYGIKQILKSGLSSTKDLSRYMIPSLALNVIVGEYEDKNYPGVLTLCERMLNGVKNFDNHIEFNIHYWQCLALCRTKNKKLFEAVEFFKEYSPTYHFLLGFYYRMREDWKKAEEEYEKALRKSKENAENNKLKQEIVLVRIKNGDYSGALTLAEENYKRQRFNAFFIEAYFRCLVNNPYSDSELLNSLISDMEKSQAKNHKEIADTMRAEYKYYYEGKFWEAIKLLQNTIEKYHSMQYPREVYKIICWKEKQPQIYKAFMKQYD